jgi:hypothetical protein
MRRHLHLIAAAACLAAAPARAAEQQQQQQPPPPSGHAAALARLAERAPELFRVWPEEGAASEYAIEPKVPRLPVRLTVSGDDDVNLDRRCALEDGVLRAALENGLADAGFALAAEDGPGGDAIEVLLAATTAAREGERCLDLVTAEARLSRTLAEAGGAAYLFEPLIHTESALVEHRPRDFPTRPVEDLVASLVAAIEAAVDDDGPP